MRKEARNLEQKVVYTAQWMMMVVYTTMENGEKTKGSAALCFVLLELPRGMHRQPILTQSWVLLDNQSMVNAFSNSKLLRGWGE
eukprot:6008483-Ditylum_brightwellii.AAC.1